MGRTMIKSFASTMFSQSLSSANGNIDESEEDGVELLQTETLLDYLCNLSPHRYWPTFSMLLLIKQTCCVLSSEVNFVVTSLVLCRLC